MLCAAGVAHADSKSLPPIVAIKDVTATSTGDPRHPITAVLNKGEWCGARKDPQDTVTLTFADATPLDAIRLYGTGAAQVAATADEKPMTATAGKTVELKVEGAPRVVAIKLTPEKNGAACLQRVELVRAKEPVAAVLAGADALAALPAAILAISSALDKCDATAIGDSVDFPFVYKNAQHESRYDYKTAENLVKACSDWRKKAANVDMDMISAPVPDGVFIRFSDIDVHGEGPGKIAIGVSHVKREQFWRLQWRDAKWHLGAIDY
jgi:hypothetical protein